MKQAVFSLIDYKFDHVIIDMKHAIDKGRLNLDIIPSGKFSCGSKQFLLNFLFIADSGTERVAEVNCVATFEFKEIDSLEDIPPFFYANSIAIVFPYVRAFISTLTLQANYPPIVLPTMNLSNLNEKLRNEVTVVE